MDNVLWLQIISYVGFVAFIIFFVARAVKYQNMPVHLRWELYPLAGEKLRKYGGSYLEDFEWWHHKHKKSLVSELVYMAKEILTFSEYRHRNRGYWYFVLPFHIGGYFLVAWLVLLIISAITIAAGQSINTDANAWGQLIYYLTLIVGVAAFVIGGLGCLGLLIRRATNENLKVYTTRVDYLTLLMILAIFVTGLVSWATSGMDFISASLYLESLITFSAASDISVVLAIQFLLLAILAAYMPFTPMMHYIAKHFTFNEVRWNDHPNLRGSKVEKEVQAALNYQVTWSASHIQPGKTWAEIATSGVDSEEKQE
jgi:nitrate reductase gamma subunit